MNTGRKRKQKPASAGTLGGKGTLPAQRTGFNTLDNWGHKTPTQSKRKRTGKKRLKGHGLEHVYNTLGYIYIKFIVPSTTIGSPQQIPGDGNGLICGSAARGNGFWPFRVCIHQQKVMSSVVLCVIQVYSLPGFHWPCPGL